MKRYFYSATISNYITSSDQEIFGALSQNSGFADEITQKQAWSYEIKILKEVLKDYHGSVFFEYSIPRMGRRIDVVLIIKNVIFILEFKVGEKDFSQSSIDQVWDYALDLKNFHETSHTNLIAPVLIATEAKVTLPYISTTSHNDDLLLPIKTNSVLLGDVIDLVLKYSDGEIINSQNWSEGRYSPTPTIIEAAMALYNGHSVSEISRSDATARNLSDTSNALSDIIISAKDNSEKAICFVTGVPGAGKTLVGLDVATKYLNKEKKITSVFLSGNSQ